MFWDTPKFTSAVPSQLMPEIGSRYAVIDARVCTGIGVIDPGWMLVEDGRIAGVGDAERPAPSDCPVIDGTGMTVLPGLIDCHLHLSWNGVFEPYPFTFGESLGERLQRNAWITLASGVTTAREMPGFGAAELKRKIASGRLPGRGC